MTDEVDARRARALARALAEMARIDPSIDSASDVLDRLVAVANDTIEAAQMTALSLKSDGRLTTAAATHPAALALEAVQHAAEAGPTFEALREAAPAVVPSAEHESRWPAFAAFCRAHTVRSVMSVPVASREAVGVLTFYAESEAAFDAADPPIALALAAQAAAVITHHRTYVSAKRVADELARALDMRVAVAQATGILMGQGASGDSAGEILAELAEQSKRKVHDVARDIVAEAQAGATDPSAD